MICFYSHTHSSRAYKTLDFFFLISFTKQLVPVDSLSNVTLATRVAFSEFYLVFFFQEFSTVANQKN